MGTHLYIENKATGEEIPIHFMSVTPLHCYEIVKKDELIHFLEFHRMMWESGQSTRKQQLKEISGKKPNKQFVEFLITEYEWENNVGFKNQAEKTDRIAATRHMMEWEIDRHARFGMTPEVVKSILGSFIEGTHKAYTG